MKKKEKFSILGNTQVTDQEKSSCLPLANTSERAKQTLFFDMSAQPA
jgi:hypothetical protein